MRKRILVATLVSVLLATGAFASWYDDYDAGIAAVRKGQWAAVVQKMTAAINGNGSENNHARTYGAIFINYHPYYYRGLAYLNLGKYEQAVKDLEQTSGPGEVDQGPIEVLIQRAKSRLESSSASEPVPVPVPPTPAPNRPIPLPPSPQPQPVPAPVSPSIDPALRQQFANEINNAKSHMSAARGRRAEASPSFSEGSRFLMDANTRSGAARSNDDLRAAIASAQNAALAFDNATAQVVASSAPPPPKTTGAADLTLGDTRRRLRQALSSYFNGEFDDATPQFERLSSDLPRNGWIWAFLGASQYSRYAFEGDESYKAAAMRSFKKAKQTGKFGNGLPERYFSKRIRNAFNKAG